MWGVMKGRISAITVVFHGFTEIHAILKKQIDALKPIP